MLNKLSNHRLIRKNYLISHVGIKLELILINQIRSDLVVLGLVNYTLEAKAIIATAVIIHRPLYLKYWLTS